ncbi:hypothetical protein BD324DRAFT_612510 [Kockovaella imperatae]|uniref:Uncharacterized protein n=1 Tax=Kockovaella imperatae TaxID=4999 RepID=A0A1Y1USA5_9TREE|nr:hypothetical protein BD324DRAFT_612510 [Kockovaella imperatae]ORX40903.1 hypothetical protein BD324DRAFT_612510 [Kockovaella imperatae]
MPSTGAYIHKWWPLSSVTQFCLQLAKQTQAMNSGISEVEGSPGSSLVLVRSSIEPLPTADDSGNQTYRLSCGLCPQTQPNETLISIPEGTSEEAKSLIESARYIFGTCTGSCQSQLMVDNPWYKQEAEVRCWDELTTIQQPMTLPQEILRDMEWTTSDAVIVTAAPRSAFPASFGEMKSISIGWRSNKNEENDQGSKTFLLIPTRREVPYGPDSFGVPAPLQVTEGPQELAGNDLLSPGQTRRSSSILGRVFRRRSDSQARAPGLSLDSITSGIPDRMFRSVILRPLDHISRSHSSASVMTALFGMSRLATDNAWSIGSGLPRDGLASTNLNDSGAQITTSVSVPSVQVHGPEPVELSGDVTHPVELPAEDWLAGSEKSSFPSELDGKSTSLHELPC